MSTSADIANLRKKIDVQARKNAKGDPFFAFGLKPGCSDDDVRKAWHRLNRTFHPDRYYNQDLPPDLRNQIEDIYSELQEWYEKIEDREDRRRFLLSRRNAAVSSSTDSDRIIVGSSGSATTGPAAGGARQSIQRISETAEAAVAKGHYESAISTYNLAHQMDKSAGYAEKAKLVELLQKMDQRLTTLLEEGTVLLDSEIDGIKTTIAKVLPVLPPVANLLQLLVEFLLQHSDDEELLATILNRLLKLNRMPATLVLAAKVNMKNNRNSTALDLLDEAKRSDPGNAEIKDLIKRAKRKS